MTYTNESLTNTKNTDNAKILKSINMHPRSYKNILSRFASEDIDTEYSAAELKNAGVIKSEKDLMKLEELVDADLLIRRMDKVKTQDKNEYEVAKYTLTDAGRTYFLDKYCQL